MMYCDVQITDGTATTHGYINSPKFIEFIPIIYTRNSSFGIQTHDDVIKWIHFPRKWPFVRGIHRSAVNSPQKVQWRGALMLSFICVWLNGWVNNREAGDLRRYRAHYDVTVMRLGIRCYANVLYWLQDTVPLSVMEIYYIRFIAIQYDIIQY